MGLFDGLFGGGGGGAPPPPEHDYDDLWSTYQGWVAEEHRRYDAEVNRIKGIRGTGEAGREAALLAAAESRDAALSDLRQTSTYDALRANYLEKTAPPPPPPPTPSGAISPAGVAVETSAVPKSGTGPVMYDKDGGDYRSSRNDYSDLRPSERPFTAPPLQSSPTQHTPDERGTWHAEEAAVKEATQPQAPAQPAPPHERPTMEEFYGTPAQTSGPGPGAGEPSRAAALGEGEGRAIGFGRTQAWWNL